MNDPRSLLLSLACLLGICTHVASGQEWSRFRGPNGAGETDAISIPSKWTDRDYLWKVALPGIGHSSPVVWGEKVFVTSSDPETGGQHLLCFNAADGEEHWSKHFSSESYPLHQRNSFASATPAVDEDRLYVTWGTPKKFTLMALDHDGGKMWDIDLGPFESNRGFSVSPVVYGDLVVLSNQQLGKSFVIAVDRHSGEERWRTERQSRQADYSTPSVYQPPGEAAQFICNNNGNGITSIDPTNGKVNWEIDVFTMRSVSSPIVAGGLIFGSCGTGGGGNYVVAIRPGGSGGQAPEEVYRVKTSAPYVPTPVADGNLVFLWSDNGVVTCIDAPTGDVHWRQRVGGNYDGSPIRSGKRIFAISVEGVVVVLAADREFKLLGRNPLGDPSRATPAVAGGRMFLRTYSSLICVGGS